MKKTFLFLFLVLSFPIHAYYYGQNKVQTVKEAWSRIATMHFDIYFPKGEDEFGRKAALLSEEAYYYLKKDFKNPIINRLPIIFYQTHSQFQTTNIVYPLLSEGVGGFTESLRDRVVIPFDGSYKKLEEVLTHELTHAYVNSLEFGGSSSHFFNSGNFYFPFWFSEGLPEFEAIGGLDAYNNMFIIDMILNDTIQPMESVDGYYAYRQGESFLAFLNKRYGRDKVMNFFFALRTVNQLDKATEKVFGMKFRELEMRWKNELKRDYYPYISEYSIPMEGYTKITNHKMDGSYFNCMPSFAADGRKVLYVSNRNLRFGIWSQEINGEKKTKHILGGEATGKIEEFHFQRNNISWFPDSLHFAFVSKTSKGDRINVADVKKGRITHQITIPQLDVLYEIDISPDGNDIVLSGQKQMKTDLYIYHLATGELTPLTSDEYEDHQPQYSPDGKKIAFASERDSLKESFRKGILSELANQIYYYDLPTHSFFQVTADSCENYSPMWDSTGTKLLYLSDEQGIANYKVIDITTGKRAQVTKTLCGVQGGELNGSNDFLAFSCFFDNGWDIYTKVKPLENLDWQMYHTPAQVSLKADFDTRFAFERYRYYGKRDMKFQNAIPQPTFQNGYVVNMRNAVVSDSLIHINNLKVDEKPDSVNVPGITFYKPKFYIDTLWGGAAYSTSYGTIGQLNLGLSDLMGNHAIGIQLGISGNINDADIIMSYLYLPYKIDYGIGIFKYNDETVYEPYYDEFYRIVDTQTGIYLLTRYPFTKFLRVDLEHYLYQTTTHMDYWVEDYYGEGTWEKIPNTTSSDFIYAPALSVVFDNSVYGPTGPILGVKGFYHIQKSIAREENDFLTNYADVRAYELFAKRYAFAERIIGGISTGKNPQYFALNGFSGVRGYDDDHEGTRKFLVSGELRVPFIDYVTMAFPLPLTLNQIRASGFVDMGAVWVKDKSFRGSEDGRLKDMIMGFGFGPRINVGYFVLKWDVAWRTDFIDHSKPVYYFSLSEDF